MDNIRTKKLGKITSKQLHEIVIYCYDQADNGLPCLGFNGYPEASCRNIVSAIDHLLDDKK